MRKIICAAAVLSAALVALVCPTTASAGAGGTERPYTAAGVMTGFVDPVTLDWMVTGRTVGTHYGMGPTTVVGSFIQGTAVFTVTAANGDTIRGEFVGQADPVGNECPEGWDSFSDLDRFTGGTGRFANASGTLNIWGCAVIDFTTAAFTISFAASGTISY